jgi:hypothetical protein
MYSVLCWLTGGSGYLLQLTLQRDLFSKAAPSSLRRIRRLTSVLVPFAYITMHLATMQSALFLSMLPKSGSGSPWLRGTVGRAWYCSMAPFQFIF